MKKHKRPTKLEEASLSVHLDIDGDKSEVLDDALFQIKQVAQLIVGQDNVENHDVTLEVRVVLRERPKTDPPKQTSKLSRDVGVGQRV